MPRPSSITKELVFDIACELMDKGVHPAVNTVQAEIKKRTGKAGSTQIVSGYLAQLREEVVKRLRSPYEPALGAAIGARIAALTEAIMDEAVQQARAGVEADTRELQERLLEASSQLSAARSESQTYKQAADQATRALSEMQKTHDDCRQRLAEHVSRVEVLESANVLLRGENADLKQMIGSLQDKLQEQVKLQAGDLSRLHGDAEQRINEQRSKFEVDIAREREVWRGERTYLHKQIDEVRMTSKERIETLQRQLEGANEMVTQLRRRSTSLEEQVAKWQAIAEQAQEALTRAHHRADPV